MTIFEGDEFGSTNSSNRSIASEATFGEKFTKAFGTVWFFVTAGESFSSQAFLAVCAGEALTMPGLVLVGYAAAGDHLVTLDAPSSVLVLVALSAVDFLFTGDETLGTNGNFAYTTAETFLVPLPGFVFHLLRSSSKDFVASVAPGSELLIVAASTVNTISLGSELLVYQRFAASSA